MRRLINKVYVASITAQASVQKSNLSPPCGKWSPGGLELIGTGQFNCEMSVSSRARRNLKPLRCSRRVCERGGSWQDAKGKYSQLFFFPSSHQRGEGREWAVGQAGFYRFSIACDISWKRDQRKTRRKETGPFKGGMQSCSLAWNVLHILRLPWYYLPKA